MFIGIIVFSPFFCRHRHLHALFFQFVIGHPLLRYKYGLTAGRCNVIRP